VQKTETITRALQHPGTAAVMQFTVFNIERASEDEKQRPPTGGWK